MNATWGHRRKPPGPWKGPYFLPDQTIGTSDQLSMGWSRLPEFKAHPIWLHFLLQPQGTSEPLVCQAEAGQGGSGTWPSGWGGSEKEIGGKSMVGSATDWPDQIVPGRQGLLSFKSKPMVGPDKSKMSTFPTPALAVKSPQRALHQIRRAKSYTWASQQP